MSTSASPPGRLLADALDQPGRREAPVGGPQDGVGAGVGGVDPGLDPLGLRPDDIVAPSTVRDHYSPPGGRRGPLRPVLFTVALADSIALAVALLAAAALSGPPGSNRSAVAGLEFLLYLPLFLALFSGYGLYRRGRRRLVASMFPDLSQLIHSLMLGCIVMLALARPFSEVGLPHASIRTVLVFGGSAVVLVPIARALLRWAMTPSTGHSSRILIVGSGVVASSVKQRLSHSGSVIVGCVDDSEMASSYPEGIERLGALDDLPAITAAHNVDHIIVAFSPATGAKLASQLRSLADDVRISVVPRLFDLLTVRSSVDDLHGLPVVDVAPASLGPADRFLKRAIDIGVSSVALTLLSPLLLVLATAIKVTSPGPVLFRQQRTGRKGNAFKICKFRTMRQDAEQQRDSLVGGNEVDGPLFKLRVDPRVTAVGKVLRTTSLDELPQLLNVLTGDMSLVGPRPFVIKESAEIAGWAARRFDVRPGMTGLWQISGRSDLPFDELCRLDYSYVSSWSLWWDLRIIWHTPASVLGRHGAY